MKVLTSRETDVAVLVTHEYAVKQIADTLCVSEETVKTHKKNIFKKWGCKNNVGIATRYLLSLENPKAFVPGMFFLMLHLGMTFGVVDFDARKTRRGKSSRVVKSVKRGRRLNEYYV